jgi:hypothetical protein
MITLYFTQVIQLLGQKTILVCHDPARGYNYAIGT